jgi:hypothetical protein
MVEMMFRRIAFSLSVVFVYGFAGMGCDKVPLLAPTNSTVTIDAQTRVVPNGGSTSVTATVLESSGTPVQNGTLVRFTTTLGRIDPAEVQTRNGMATTTFFAGDDSGIAEVRATSGGAGAGGSTSTPTTPTPGNGGDNNQPTTPTTPTTSSTSNIVQIAVGAGAVNTVTVSTNPSSVSTTGGGTVTVTATALGTGGRLLSGIPVNFTVNRGTLSATSAVTNAQGQAQVTLTTNGETTVTVFAGTVKAEATVTGRPGPSVVLTCTVGSANNCAIASVGQTVVFNAAREANSGTLTSASIDFGDNSSQSLGTLSSPTTVPHTYTQAGTYTARLTGTDGTGESSSSVQVIQVSAATATISTGKSGNTVTATATVSAPVTQYAWDFGDGFTTTTTTNTAQRTYLAAGTYVITVTATLQGGGTVSGTTTVAVP